VWTSSIRAESLDKLGDEIVRHGVFEAFRLIVDSKPFHPEELNQHSLDQMMPQANAFCDVFPLRRQYQTPVFLDLDEAITFEPPQRHRDSARGYFHPPNERGSDDGLALCFRLGDRLDVILLGY
jgi:hypothetical protein